MPGTRAHPTMPASDTLDLFLPPPDPARDGRVVSIHISNGGVPKLAIDSATVTADGILGDRQRNLQYHGGPDRALCLYSLELIEALRGEGHPIAPGSIGENVLVAGIDWRRMVPGVRARLGSAEIEVTSYAFPCRNIRGSFRNGRVSRVSPETHPGWSRVYARVLEGGALAPKDPVKVL